MTMQTVTNSSWMTSGTTTSVDLAKTDACLEGGVSTEIADDLNYILNPTTNSWTTFDEDTNQLESLAYLNLPDPEVNDYINKNIIQPTETYVAFNTTGNPETPEDDELFFWINNSSPTSAYSGDFSKLLDALVIFDPIDQII